MAAKADTFVPMPNGPPIANTPPASALAPASPAPRLRLALLAATVILAGLAMRVFFADLATRYGYRGDHTINLCWGLTANTHGLFQIYNVRPDQFPDLPWRKYSGGRFILEEVPGIDNMAPNYPPLGLTAHWLEAKLLLHLPGRVVGNTLTSRLAMGSVATLFDAGLCAGLLLLGRRLFGRRAGRVAAAVAWLFPPLAMNAFFWGQVDSFFLAPAVFVVYLVIGRRWVLAGLCWGLAFLLKPQAILLTPIVLFAAACVGRSVKAPPFAALLARLARLAKIAGVAALTALVVASPWMMTSGRAWIDVSYVDNLLHQYPQTTLNAYNLWYLDVLRLDGTPDFVLDSGSRIAGMTKDAWGRILLIAAILALAAVCWRRYRRDPRGVVVFAAMALWSAFMLPTRVHDRYIIYCVPFVIALAPGMRRYWPALAGLLIVTAAEHCWPSYLGERPAGTLMTRQDVEHQYARSLREYEEKAATRPADRRGDRPTMAQAVATDRARAIGERPEYQRDRARLAPWEYSLTILSLLTYGYAVIVCCLGMRHSCETPDTAGSPE
jgi:hypothetical protein